MATPQLNGLSGAALRRRNILVLGVFATCGILPAQLTPLADGGGVRGLSSLFILRALLDRVEVHVRDLTGEAISFRPHDIFSLAVGTSTGGYAA